MRGVQCDAILNSSFPEYLRSEFYSGHMLLPMHVAVTVLQILVKLDKHSNLFHCLSGSYLGLNPADHHTHQARYPDKFYFLEYLAKKFNILV